MENMMLYGSGCNTMLLAAQHQCFREEREISFSKKMNRISRKPEKSPKENIGETRCLLAIGNYRLILKNVCENM